MIIVPFLRSGDLVVLHICRKITEEALQRINHEATFRINFNIEGRRNTSIEQNRIPSDLQNVEIRFQLIEDSDYYENAFQSSSIRHLSYRDDARMTRCYVTFYYRGYYTLEEVSAQRKLKEILPREPQLLPMLMYALSGYTHFNTVGIKVLHNRHSWVTDKEQYLNSYEPDAQFLTARLEPALGPGKLINADGWCHTEFLPRDFSSSGLKKAPPKPNLTAKRCRPWCEDRFVLLGGPNERYYKRRPRLKPRNWDDEWHMCLNHETSDSCFLLHH